MLAYPAASCGDRGRIPSGCAIMFSSYIAGKPREAVLGFNARAIVFNKRWEKMIFRNYHFALGFNVQFLDA